MTRHAVHTTVALAVLSLSVLGPPVQAQDKQTPAQIFTDLRLRAEQDDVEAQYILGVMYAEGRDVPQDDAEAGAWFHRAAAQGHSSAQYSLGVMYDTGRRVPQDTPTERPARNWDTRAIKDWFSNGVDGPRNQEELARAKAVISMLLGSDVAEQLQFNPQDTPTERPARNWDTKAIKDWFSNGVDGPRNQEELARAKAVISMLLGSDVAEQLQNLGVVYNTGRGVSQDDAAEAATWYRKAAEQGHASAQYNLGLMHSEGQGVPQDNVEAHMWLNLAAAKSTGEKREQAVTARDRVAEQMTSADLSEAQHRAREWYAAHQVP